MTNPTRIVVVGAGPAGLMAALAAAEAGAAVLLLERMQRPGTKLVATGGGRCNLTNTLSTPDFLARFEKRQARFIRPAMHAFDTGALRAFFDDLNVPTHTADGFHVFPVSENAKAVRGALLTRLSRLGVEIRTGVEVRGIGFAGPRVESVQTAEGSIPADHVILAAGGNAWPALGSNGSGFDIAQSAGHSIVQPVPALVPLLTRESWPGACAGIVIARARVHLDRKGGAKHPVEGDLLFTHHGISGPAVLDISREVARVLATGVKDVGLILQLTNESCDEVWRDRIADLCRKHPRRLVRNLFSEILPQSLGDAWTRIADVPDDTQAAHLKREASRALAGMLAGIRVSVKATAGQDKAMVTSGGVSTREVDPTTMRSRMVSGLSFAGETLDIDGPCGGYNLQWAFASGRLAGLSAERAD